MFNELTERGNYNSLQDSFYLVLGKDLTVNVFFFVRVILGQLALFRFLKIKNWKLHILDFHLLSGLKKWQHQKSESNPLSAGNPVFFRVQDSHIDCEQPFILFF